MKSQKVTRSIQKGVRRIPPAGTAEFELWRKRVTAGRRKATAHRRKAGWRTIRETAKERGVSPNFLGRMADRGEIEVVESGSRRYIHESEAERVFGKRRDGDEAA
jgi:hypothetical protein